MADNVMALIKRKGVQKKLRGKAAQRQKHREATAAQPKRIQDKRNPFRQFRYMEPDELLEEIDEFIDNAGWTQDRQVPDPTKDRDMIRMFNIIKSGIPYPFVKTFFTDFDESNSVNVIRYFEEFRNRPHVNTAIESMKELIIRRKATPLQREHEELSKVFPKDVVPKEPRLRHRELIPTERPKVMFGEEELLSQCEREYRRAPWMFPFTDKVIRGFALKVNDQDEKDGNNQYIIKQKVKDGWYKVNMRWYKMSCDGKRKFIPDKVAYVTIDNDIIVETEDMYKASQHDWKHKFTPLNKTGFDIAKSMIMDNQVLKSAYSGDHLDQYVTEIIASFGPIKTNYDMARKVSYILVFMSSLIDDPQQYHEMIRSKKYPANTLINLDRYTLLPEVFSNPNVDKAPIENNIKRSRSAIENKYHELLKQNDPTVRKRTKPRIGVPPPSPSSPPSPPSPPRVEDALIEDALIEDVAPVPKIQRKPRGELAPGLFQKLKERINKMTPTYCNQCETEVFEPPYVTPRGAQRLRFCSKECFDKYDI